MLLLFCNNGFSYREVDYAFAEEYQATKQAGCQTALISFEDLTKRKDPLSAIRHVRAPEEMSTAIYRGWMLSPDDYTSLYNALWSNNIRLINSPEAYQFCHYLPDSYESIKSKTPRTVWLDITNGYEEHQLIDLAAVFGRQPIIVKDYVKSQKHYWNEACFIPDASDAENVLKITRKFLELQDVDLAVGIVYRAFIPFKPLTNHSQSGMPLTKEFRVFVLHGKIISLYKYWDEGEYDEALPDLETFQPEMDRIQSNFYTMDIAQTTAGDWLIVELGDAQVSGLPENADKLQFFEALQNHDKSWAIS